MYHYITLVLLDKHEMLAHHITSFAKFSTFHIFHFFSMPDRFNNRSRVVLAPQ